MIVIRSDRGSEPRRLPGSSGEPAPAPPETMVAPAGDGWFPASSLLTGHDRLEAMLDAAKQRWVASPHVAAALAWRSYTYWLALPVVRGWARTRRVPLLDPDDVLLRFTPAHGRPLVEVGLRHLRQAVLVEDPLVEAGGWDLTVAHSEPALLAVLRETLRDRHLDRLMTRLQVRVNLGPRTLLGGLASAVAYAVARGVTAPPAEQHRIAVTLLATLGVADLVEVAPAADGLTVHRRTCCLAFALPEPKICSGCVLRR